MDGMRVVYGGRVDSVEPVSPAPEGLRLPIAGQREASL